MRQNRQGVAGPGSAPNADRDSETGSETHIQSSPAIQKTSLEVLQNQSSSWYGSGTIEVSSNNVSGNGLDPSSFSLPESHTSASQQATAHFDQSTATRQNTSPPGISSHDASDRTAGVGPPQSDQHERHTYLDLVRLLSEDLPHLIAVAREDPDRVTCARVSILDMNGSTNRLRRHDLKDWEEVSVDEFRSIVEGDVPDDSGQRVIIVEDLSSALIERLGSVLMIDPDCFAEHLCGSRYQRRETWLDDSAPNEWLTRRMEKKHFSLSWWRPVHRSEFRQQLNRKRWERALETGSCSWGSAVSSPSPQGPLDIENHTVFLTPNTIRRQWSPIAPLDEDAGLMAWKEKATLYQVKKHLYLILLDPLPIVQYNVNNMLKEKWCPWTLTCPRCRPPAGLGGIPIEARMQEVKTYVRSTNSASDDLLSWINPPESAGLSVPDISDALLHIIQTDTTRLLETFSSTMNTIAAEITSELLLQENLSIWRQLLSRYLLELPKMQESLTQFSGFMDHIGASPEAKSRLKGLLLKLEDSIAQIEKSYTSLRTEMSIIDSRRSITEAESIGKLTELAFVFVPITFAASVFSMQIKELQEAVPLYSFIVACFVALGSSYSLRLLVRSSLLVNTKQALMDKVREHYGISPNRPVSTHQFLMFILIKKRIGYLVLGVIAIPVAVLVPAWLTLRLDVGFKAVITVVLVVAIVAVCFFVVYGGSGVFRSLGYKIANREYAKRARVRVASSGISSQV